MSHRRRARSQPVLYFKGFLTGETILARLALRGESRRVLSALRGVMDYENWVSLPLRDIAKDCRIPWSQFSRGMAQLRETPKSSPILAWEEHPSGGIHLRVALWTGWRGRDERHERAMRDGAEAQLTLFPLAAEA